MVSLIIEESHCELTGIDLSKRSQQIMVLHCFGTKEHQKYNLCAEFYELFEKTLKNGKFRAGVYQIRV